MARVPFTLRIDAAERAALKNLSRIEGRPINQLLNDAVKSYLLRRGRRERDLETQLASLRTYRKKDPGYKHAVDALVEAEATLEDPLEGEPAEEFEHPNKPAGPVQSKIRKVIGA